MPEEEENREESAVQSVPFHKLFAFTDWVNVTLMVVGTIAAIANDVFNSLSTLVFGQLVSTLGSSDPFDIRHQVSKVYFLISYIYNT